MSFNRSAIGILMTLLTIMFGVITGLCVRPVGDAAPLITVLIYRFVCAIPLLLLLALAGALKRSSGGIQTGHRTSGANTSPQFQCQVPRSAAQIQQCSPATGLRARTN